MTQSLSHEALHLLQQVTHIRRYRLALLWRWRRWRRGLTQRGGLKWGGRQLNQLGIDNRGSSRGSIRSAQARARKVIPG
jgi:hypothetical protein